MDVSMTFTGGREATWVIRAYERTHNLGPVPIIALTTHAAIGNKERSLQCGRDDRITKPLRRTTERLDPHHGAQLKAHLVQIRWQALAA
ncbi:hypothetical protein K474DRAFT_1707848 [Panus rudis PR-1116 ss-1]|nr:hypothetical protein K474DRAFT_1707848 [Panus rudis PR-1116 ss-1]